MGPWADYLRSIISQSAPASDIQGDLYANIPLGTDYAFQGTSFSIRNAVLLVRFLILDFGSVQCRWQVRSFYSSSQGFLPWSIYHTHGWIFHCKRYYLDRRFWWPPSVDSLDCHQSNCSTSGPWPVALHCLNLTVSTYIASTFSDARLGQCYQQHQRAVKSRLWKLLQSTATILGQSKMQVTPHSRPLYSANWVLDSCFPPCLLIPGESHVFYQGSLLKSTKDCTACVIKCKQVCCTFKIRNHPSINFAVGKLACKILLGFIFQGLELLWSYQWLHEAAVSRLPIAQFNNNKKLDRTKWILELRQEQQHKEYCR